MTAERIRELNDAFRTTFRPRDREAVRFGHIRVTARK